jgi:hypothetical protein
MSQGSAIAKSNPGRQSATRLGDADSAAWMVGQTTPLYLGLAVLASWLTLRAGGWWRAEPSWIDRLGRALGVLWIAEAVIWAALIAVGR